MTELCTKSENPTHGSEWIVQIFSNRTHHAESEQSHQRQLVDGSDPLYLPGAQIGEQNDSADQLEKI